MLDPFFIMDSKYAIYFGRGKNEQPTSTDN